MKWNARHKVYNFFLIFFAFSLTCPKAKIRKKNSIYSNKFFHNFHLSKSSFTCSGLWASGLVRSMLNGTRIRLVCH